MDAALRRVLPASGWRADDRPALELYGADIAVEPQTGAFSCSLALPVRWL